MFQRTMACLFAVCAVACSGKVVHESASSQNAGGKSGASEGGTTDSDASRPSGVLTLASQQALPSSIATDGKDVYRLNIGQIHRNGTKDPPDRS